ncbi:MAG: hypothetical protein IT382_03630 [Deltaproteobacteria bacterium]|nr:hypothetical protein [Deltaproteobacteria bacterium]
MRASRGMALGAVVVAGALAAAPPAAASQAQLHVVEGSADLLEGDLEGAALGSDGVVRVGEDARLLAGELSGPVLAVARAGDGQLYAATAAPGRVWRIVEGKAPEAVLESDKPLVTALLPLGKGKLAALTAPEGGAELIDLASKKSESIAAKDAKMLLAGAVLDDVVYAVGGGEEGVLLKLAPGAKAFEVVAKVKEPQLRSVAVARKGGAVRVVVGGGEEGVVYEVIGGKARALLDADAGEITAIALGPDGVVYAAAVDGEGKLSKGAAAKAKDEGDDDKKSGKKKARKVKGAELWRIDAAGRASILWQSKSHGAYALALKDGKLLAGTGPQGRLLELDPRGEGSVGVRARLKDHDEITSLFLDGKTLYLGTSHGSAVARLGGARSGGTYLSPALDAEGLARYGLATARASGTVKLSVRSGNTKEPDDTWSTFGPAEAAPAGQYAQVRAELSPGATVGALSLSYLVDNRAPSVDRVDVLAPGWKVVANLREAPETRSVTFNEKPFAKFLDRRGGQNPTLDERPFGKQSFDVGYRTVYAWVEDPDKDALRYRFFLGRVTGASGEVSTWSALKGFTEEPFASFEASRLADGQYRVKVEVDDVLTNGPARKLGDSETGPVFVVSHETPRMSGARAVREQGKIRLKLDVAGALPLTVVRCSAGGDEWVPLDPKDGITDGTRESFEQLLEGTGSFESVSCEVYDEALNFGRIDIPLG